jgi:aminomethyltransferase
MSRTIPNPLLELHQKADAEVQAYDQVQIVSTFGEPEAEYAAIRKAAAVIDQPQRGLLELSGKDRLSFLNNLLTNQTWDKAAKRGLEVGQGVYAFFLGKNGRIVADMTVIERPDRTLLEMDARLVEPVRAAFEKYLFGEQVKMTDRVEAIRQISIHGPQALSILRQAAGAEIAELVLLGSAEIRLYEVSATVWRDDPAAVTGYHLLIETDSVERVWTGLLGQFGQATELGRRALRPAGWAAFNATRVEAGRPFFGIDFDDTVLPHETGLISRAVSFTKGCYLGQEIVARMQARGQFARQIVGIRMTDDSLPIAGAVVYDDNDNQIGGITSSTVSPVLSNAAICLGFVKKAFTPVGTVLTIPAEGKMRKGSVAELPFVRGGQGLP